MLGAWLQAVLKKEIPQLERDLPPERIVPPPGSMPLVGTSTLLVLEDCFCVLCFRGYPEPVLRGVCMVVSVGPALLHMLCPPCYTLVAMPAGCCSHVQLPSAP